MLFSAAEAAPIRLSITDEESDLQVWQQLLSNGSLSSDQVEMKDVSTIADSLNSLSLKSNFLDEDTDSPGMILKTSN